MTVRPPDLEPDEEPISELEALIPDAEPIFRAEVRDRLNQRLLSAHVTTAASWGLVAAAIQLFTAFFTLLGITKTRSGDGPDE